jgi:DNA-binding transcriptional LysR family regulator
MLDWNDLRYFLAVARNGSTLAAAKALGVNQSTVQRRLAVLDEALGQPLATRHPSGYQLTEFGRGLLPYARSVEDAVLALDIAGRGLGEEPAGAIRFTCPEPVLARLVATGIFERFAHAHPRLSLDLLSVDRYLDLWRDEADVALRSGDPEDIRLVGRKVADSLWAIYAARDYLGRHGRPSSLADLAHHEFVVFDGAMSNHRANTWLAATLPDARIAARNSSVLGVLAAARAGVGIAALPTTLAASDEALEEVLPPIPALSRGWYLLTRPDLRSQPRIAAFYNFMISELPALRTALQG